MQIMVALARGDYAIVPVEKRKVLLKVVTDGASCRGVVMDASAAHKETRTYHEFEPGAALANLGPTPPVGGSVYGVKIEPFRKLIVNPIWGDVLVFRDIDATEERFLQHHMTRVGTRLRDELGVLPFRKDTQIHIRTPGGKYPGMYVHDPKGHDTIIYKIQTFDSENMDYYQSHEWGHGMWFTMMPPAWRAKWINFYVKNTQKIVASPTRMRALMGEWITSAAPIREFHRSLQDHDQPLMTEIMLFLRRTYALDPRHLDELRQEASEQIEPIWPKSAVELPQRNVLVSEYANKSADELWCESLAFWFMGHKIPQVLENAVKQTIQACRHS